MKKGFYFVWSVVVIASLVLGVLGCAKSAAPAPAPTAAVPAPAAQPIVLKAIDSWNANYVVTVRWRQMLDEFNKLAPNRIRIEYLGGEEIVPARDQLNAVGTGTIDTILGTHPYYAGTVPEGGILALPVVVWNFDNADKLSRAVQGDLDKIYTKKANARYLQSFSDVAMNVFLGKKQVAAVAEMNAMKIRTIGGWDAAALKALGAATVSIPSGEIYSAAQTGVIDGASRPTMAIEEWKEHEVWKYMITTPISMLLGGNWFMNADTFNKLPPDLQKMVLDFADKQQTITLKWFTELTKEREKRLVGLGIKMVDLPAAEVDKWNSILAKTAEEYFLKAAPENGAALIAKLKAAAGK